MNIQKFEPTDIMSMGKAFAESGMFTDIKTAAQAIVKIQAGQEIGLPPFASMTGIHIIQGKPTIGAGLIASTIKGSGKYDYRVIEQSEKICTIDFFQSKEKIGTSTFTIEDAKKAGTKNIDKFPKNMLFARAISNGVKWFCPDVFAGPVYTPEEMQVVVEEQAQFEVLKPSYDATIQVINAATSTEMLTQIWQQLNVDAKSEATVIEAVKVKGELLKFESFLITAYDNQVLAYRQALQNEVDHSINVGATPEQILLEEVAIPKIEKFEAKSITKEQMMQIAKKIVKPDFKAICAEFRKQLK